MRLALLAMLFGGLALPAAAADSTESSAQPSERMNILFILSDDHRSDFLSCAGHPVLQTPAIDSLARRGTRFENAFVTTAICAASRATILTGLYETSHGFTFKEGPLDDDELAASYPMQLREAGYRTGFYGKFGVEVPGARYLSGYTIVNGQRGPPAEWIDRMFSDYEQIHRQPYFKNQPDGTVRHTSDLIGDRGVDFIRDAASDEQPWCLSISFNAGHAEDGDKARHYPFPPSEAGLYAQASIPPPRYPTDEWEKLPKFFHNSMQRQRYFWRWDTPEKYRKNMTDYLRLLSGMDRNIGRMLEALELTDQTDRTAVIFIGDNGYYAGSRGFAGKWSHHEESLRVPLVIALPGGPEQIRSEEALNLDMAPTMLDLAGVEAPAAYQGRSLKAIAEGATPDAWRDDFFIEHRMREESIPKYEGVRAGSLKYARYIDHLAEADDEDGNGVFVGEFLHDLDADPSERTNYAADPTYRDRLDRLRARTDEYLGQLTPSPK